MPKLTTKTKLAHFSMFLFNIQLNTQKVTFALVIGDWIHNDHPKAMPHRGKKSEKRKKIDATL